MAKRISLLLLTAALVFSMLGVFASTADTEAFALALGDVDGDGQVGVTDYIALKMHVKNISPLPEEKNKSADLNGDNVISSIDLITLQMHIKGYIELECNHSYTD